MKPGDTIRLHLLLATGLLTPAVVQAQAAAPTGVSPGGEVEQTQIEQRCPTFSWSGVMAAERYELAAFQWRPALPDETAWEGELAADGGVWQPVLRVEAPGEARSWTPSVGRCLELGGRYAWSVRAWGESWQSEWSRPRLFSVMAAPSVDAVREALAVLRAYVATSGRQGPETLAEPAGSRGARTPVPTGVPTPTGSPTPAGSSAAVGPPSLGGTAAISASLETALGDASGLIAQTASAEGAGAVLGNSAAGPDLFLDGTADGETGTALKQGSLDRSSGGAESFDVGNSGAGSMTLTVEGVEVVTTATDQDTLAALSCANGQVAKWIQANGRWECRQDSGTTYSAGNQLQLSGTTFDVLEGSGSGLDADRLDNLDSTAFMAAGTDNWVDTGGDTMTGTLVLNPAGGNSITTGADIELGNGDLRKGGLLFLHDNGTANTAAGLSALSANTSGLGNTAVGASALLSNTTGSSNTASGHWALRDNAAGSWNTASGALALRSNTSGLRNTASGHWALRDNSAGDDNTASGAHALQSNTTGDWNTASGAYALESNTTGISNTAGGAFALRNNTTGINNTATGTSALRDNTTGERNTASGVWALINNTAGDDNTASGVFALQSNTEGYQNTAVGVDSMKLNSDGNRNTAVGFQALKANTTGVLNTATGFDALRDSTTANFNTAIGQSALAKSTIGSDNTAVGSAALANNPSGSFNVALGSSAGIQTTGSGNILINHQGTFGESNTLRIGQFTGTGGRNLDSAFIQGIWARTATGGAGVFINSSGQLGTFVSSRRFKEEIATVDGESARLQALRPVRFRFTEAVAGPDRPLEYGLIAEEVAEVFPALVVYDDGEPLTVRYHLLAPLLLSELQRLHRALGRQDRLIVSLTERLRTLEEPGWSLRRPDLATANEGGPPS